MDGSTHSTEVAYAKLLSAFTANPSWLGSEKPAG